MQQSEQHAQNENPGQEPARAPRVPTIGIHWRWEILVVPVASRNAAP
jgi:hypothetical protein